MKHLKMLGLLVVAAVAPMAFAAPASATAVTSGAGSTPTITALNEGNLTFDGTFNVYCSTGIFVTAIESHGSGVTAKGNVSVLGFAGCGADEANVLKAGSLEFHALSGGNATVTSSGAEITTLVPAGVLGDIHCVYTTNKTHLGTLTAGTHATLDLEEAKIPRTGGSFLCGSSTTLTGSFKVSSPTNLSFDA